MPVNPPASQIYQVHTVAISVADLEQSLEWYKEHLGFKLIQRRDFPENQMFTVILGGVGFQLELIQKTASKPITQFLDDPSQPTLLQGFKKVVIKVQEVPTLYAALKQNGVNFVYPDLQVTPGIWGKWFMIEDPDGNIFQFIDAR
jgi:catechol 2,3-dioxygenase-like lactoylglutathione lyase family enzyme